MVGVAKLIRPLPEMLSTKVPVNLSLVDALTTCMGRDHSKDMPHVHIAERHLTPTTLIKLKGVIKPQNKTLTSIIYYGMISFIKWCYMELYNNGRRLIRMN